MISWSIIQSLLIFFGPLVYSKTKSFYKSTRTTLPPVALPPTTKRILDILFLTAILSLALTTPPFAPENIFTLTSSRLQTPTDVLFTRLARIRPLTAADNLLRSRLASKDARLLYAAYGPQPLMECSWCKLDDAGTFLWFALPGLLWPHLLHITVLGLATSRRVSRFGAAWRTQATLAGVTLCVAEVWIVGVSDAGFRVNAVARSEADVQWTHWRVRVLRGVAMATVDAALGYVLYLSATRRWNIGWEGQVVEERLEETFQRMERAGAFMHAGNYLKQTVLRDAELRGKSADWWAREDIVGRELMEDQEVRAVRFESLPARKNLDILRDEAEKKSEGLMSIILTGMEEVAGARPHRE